MKKYNRIIMLSVLFYLIFSIGFGYKIVSFESEKNHFYKVEINRIYNRLSEEKSLKKLDLQSYEYINKVTFLPISSKDEEKISDFFEENNNSLFTVKPWYVDQRFVGYLRFDYIESKFSIINIFILFELSLLFMEVFLLIILFYLKYKVIHPFNRISQIPYELAKGHLKDEVKADKNKYYGKFLWGISQLKDTLDVTKKRELELEKEKKQMLLSLSHDIKTPLNTIKLYGKALEENIYEEEVQKKHAAHQIGEKTKEIERYVEEIMKTSREDILDIRVKKGEFYLSDLMKKVLLTYREKCAINLIDLQVDKYENRLLKGDLDKTQEVFENIFENAFKYGDGRRIKIIFYEEDYCQLIQIFNTGDTVTDNELTHLFESFFRGSNSIGQQGSGLGLYICRKIMRKMDGEIFAEKLEDGMAFTLVIR